MSEPVTRQEQLLSAIATGGDIISPITRGEMYLAYLAGDTSVVLPEPITRKEQFLYQACLNGGGGGGTEITDGIVVKAYRQPDNWAQEVDYYCESGITPNSMFYAETYRFLTTINYKNPLTTISAGFARGRSALTTFPDFSKVTLLGNQSFYGCKLLDGVIMLPLCTSIGESSFRETNITELDAPECISVYSSGLRSGALEKVNMPKLDKLIGGNVLNGCSALETAQLGSVGYAVTQISNNDFYGCTQSGLTITVYTTGAYADTALTNIRNGATNATIIIKDSMTGETIVTSTP